MTQNPLAAVVAEKAGVPGWLQLDADGNLKVTVESSEIAALTTYETVAASSTDQVLGGTGAIGDVLQTLIIVPGTTAAGAVSIKDGGGSDITLFVGGGTTALIDLAPKVVTIGAASVAGAWKVTTGANVTVLAVGKFTA